MLAAITLQARDYWSDYASFDPGAAVYSGNELTLDLFGFHDSLDRNGNSPGAWGPGAGVNYYVTPCFGFGADTYADAFNQPYMLNFNGMARYAIPNTGVAPYGYLGIGRQWSYSPQWQANLGAGVEYRFAPKTGVFTDLRGVFAGETRDYIVWRFGFRFKF